MRDSDKNVFASEVEKFKRDYFRTDERFMVRNFMLPSKGKKVLVVGCGAGRTITYLLEYGFEVAGIDAVSEMADVAKKRFPDLDIRQMDARKLDFPNESFDIVFFPFHGICYNEKPEEIVEEAARVLKAGGVYIFSAYHLFGLKILHRAIKGRYAFHSSLWSRRYTFSDKKWLRKYFVKVKVYPRTSLIKVANWKDVVKKKLPFLSDSLYFVCVGPKK